MIFCLAAIQFIACRREFIKPMRWGFAVLEHSETVSSVKVFVAVVSVPFSICRLDHNCRQWFWTPTTLKPHVTHLATSKQFRLWKQQSTSRSITLDLPWDFRKWSTLEYEMIWIFHYTFETEKCALLLWVSIIAEHKKWIKRALEMRIAWECLYELGTCMFVAINKIFQTNRHFAAPIQYCLIWFGFNLCQRWYKFQFTARK